MDCLIHVLTCPVCQTHFSQVGKSLKCANGHTFDIAKEGYVNLQLSKLTGDTKEMLLARRDFLDREHYQPLSDSINELISDYLHHEEREVGVLPYITLLDAGCGEGYYLGRLQHFLAQQFPHTESCCVGVDVSKEAVRMAAKRYKAAHFVVANLKDRLTFANDSLHVLLNVFAPRNADEFARILTLGGIAVIAIPTATHLAQLRTVLHLLNIEEQKQQKIEEQFSDHFELLHTKTLSYMIRLRHEEIVLAATMTPNYWHRSDESNRAMEGLQELETTISFTCLVFKKMR